MLSLVLIASCAMLIGSLALARGDKESPPNTLDCAKRRPMAIGTLDRRPLSTLGRSRQSGLRTILIRIRVSAELTCTTS